MRTKVRWADIICAVLFGAMLVWFGWLLIDGTSETGGMSHGETRHAAIAVVGMPSGDVIRLHACEAEDSEECVWDAATRGNGAGESFIRHGGVTYPATLADGGDVARVTGPGR